MKKSKIFVSLLLVFSLVLSLAACGGSSEAKPAEDTAPTEQAAEVVTEPAATTAPTATPEPTATPTPTPEPTATPVPTATPIPTPIPVKAFDIPESEALEFVKSLKLGWSLGNAFDASNCGVGNELAYEWSWCGAKTKPELIQALKDKGIESIRIPVSWHNHVSDDGKYTISEAWLDRVNEVVDYAYDLGMHVTINIHHDNDVNYMYPSYEYLDQSIEYVTAIWKQLAKRFKDYDERLIFECMNEPRLVGHANEWWLNEANQDCLDAVDCINQINQAFVNTVRESGGNNKTRYLLVPGYDGSADGVLSSNFVLPTDPVKSNNNRILLEVHAYTPYNFALDKSGTDSWSSSKALDVQNTAGFMNKLYEKYVSNGIGVVIDEFGALDKKNTEARVDFHGYYVKLATMRGMTCYLWDNNAFNSSGENFGFINRKEVEWVFPEIIEAMVANAWCEPDVQ